MTSSVAGAGRWARVDQLPRLRQGATGNGHGMLAYRCRMSLSIPGVRKVFLTSTGMVDLSDRRSQIGLMANLAVVLNHVSPIRKTVVGQQLNHPTWIRADGF